MKSLILTSFLTILIFFFSMGEGKALLLETTVTAIISDVEGDSVLQVGDEVSFQWVYDLSSYEMNSYCGNGEGVCRTFNITEFTGFHFLSDASLKFSSHFDHVLNKSLVLDNHQYPHKTVVYGGIIEDVGILKFIHKCGDCYLSIVNYGDTGTMYMAVFQDGEENVKGVRYEFTDIKFNTITAEETPDPELAIKLLSNSGILEIASHTIKK